MADAATSDALRDGWVAVATAVTLPDASKTIATTAAALMMRGISRLREMGRCDAKSDPRTIVIGRWVAVPAVTDGQGKLASGFGLTGYCGRLAPPPSANRTSVLPLLGCTRMRSVRVARFTTQMIGPDVSMRRRAEAASEQRALGSCRYLLAPPFSRPLVATLACDPRLRPWGDPVATIGAFAGARLPAAR